MSRKKKLILSAFVLAAMLAIVGAGTFATFNAQAGNGGNLFADGTIVLSNKVGAGTTCLSTGGGTTDTNVNGACDQLYNATVKKPGDTATSGNIVVKNEGSLNATAFKVFTTACTDANVVAETYHGTGSVCGQLALTVQQYTDNTFATPLACLYGTGTTTCTFDPTKTVGTFQSTYNTSTNGLAIGSGLTAGSSAYFRISVQLNSTATNTVQGRQATADFTWYAQQ